MTVTLPPMLTLNNDSAESVQKAALNHFKASAFTSYTEVTPKDSAMLLVLGQKDKQAGEAVPFFLFFFQLQLSWSCEVCTKQRQCFKVYFFFPALEPKPSATPAIPITTNAPDQMPLLMQLYTSPDYSPPLDPNSKVQTDKRIYAEARNHAVPRLALASITWIYCTFLMPILTRPPHFAFVFPADFRARFRKHRFNHRGYSVFRQLQGLLPRGAGSPLHTRGLLFKLLS